METITQFKGIDSRRKWRIEFPNNKILKNCFKAYADEQYYKFMESEDVFSLETLASDAAIENFSRGNLADRKHLEDNQNFNEKCKVNLPLENIIDIECETYWRRVVDEFRFIDRLYNLKHLEPNNWKKIGVELLVAELIEKAIPAEWRWNELSNLIEIAKENIERITLNSNICAGSLGVLEKCEYLKELRLNFRNENLQFNYDKKYFEITDDEVEILGRSLMKLSHLENLSLSMFKLAGKKMKVIMKSLLGLKLKRLEFSFCDLSDESGKSIGAFIAMGDNSINEIELKGNFIGELGIKSICQGLKNFKGELNYLGLSLNPIGERGVIHIGSTILDTQQIQRLDLSGCELGGESGMIQAVRIIGIHSNLQELILSCLPNVDVERVIDSLRTNKTLTKLDIRGTQVTEDQEKQIKLLIQRNIDMNKS